MREKCVEKLVRDLVKALKHYHATPSATNRERVEAVEEKLVNHVVECVERRLGKRSRIN